MQATPTKADNFQKYYRKLILGKEIFQLYWYDYNVVNVVCVPLLSYTEWEE